MKFLNGLLRFVTGLVFFAAVLLSAAVAFGLLVYPTNEYAAVALTLVLVFAESCGLDLLHRTLFRRASPRRPWRAVLATAVTAALMIALFWVPADTFASTGSPAAEPYGIEPEFITSHTGDPIAVYVHKPAVPNGQDPILFISGGPGGYPTRTVREYLDEYVKLGYTAYTYDPIGVRASAPPKDTASYNIIHEVGVVNDIVEHYGMERVNLIASSYGGNVAPRFIAQHPERVNAYLAVDTAPLYTMSLNYPGQENDHAYYDSLEETRTDHTDDTVSQSVTELTSPRQIARILYGMNVMKFLGKTDIPYGSHEEFDYFISLLVASATGSIVQDGKVTRHMNYLSNILITASLDVSPDFTGELKELDTPPVLVVQPEFGVVPWQTHYQYREFFSDVRFVIAPGAGHSTWSSPAGRDILVRNGDALFSGNALPDEYTSAENPFPPL